MVEVGGDHGLVQREGVDPEEGEEEVGAELKRKDKTMIDMFNEEMGGIMLENKGLKLEARWIFFDLLTVFSTLWTFFDRDPCHWIFFDLKKLAVVENIRKES